MCIIITATLNKEADLEALQPLCRRFCSGFEPVTAAPIEPQLPPNRQYVVHQSGCDCNTPIGAGDQDEPPYRPSDITNLEKKGWSAARIQRWKDEKNAAQINSQRTKQDRDHSFGGTVEDWFEMIQAALQHPSVQVFGVIRHFYSTSPSTEEFRIYLALPVRIAVARPEHFIHLKEDTLLEFVR